MEKEKTQPNYDLLREQFELVAKEFNACVGFISDVKSIKDKGSFRRFFERNIEDIADKFGMDVGDTDDLEEQIKDLESEVDDLQEELDEIKTKFGTTTTYWDELKLRHFMENKENYTEWDLQKLLENGNKYLQLLN